MGKLDNSYDIFFKKVFSDILNEFTIHSFTHLPVY